MEADTPKTPVNQASFIQAAAVVAMEIGAHDFGLRERLVLELIWKRSLLIGELDAYIPKLKNRRWSYFASATRISEGMMPSIVGGLLRQQVIEEPVEGFWGFILPTNSWRVARRIEEAEVLRQLDLLERPPCLRSAMRAVFVDGMALGQGRPVAMMSAPQPESGCGAASRNPIRVADYGNPIRVASMEVEQKPHKIEVSVAQPDSGCGLMHDHEHDPDHACNSMSHDHAVQPDSGYGTGAETTARSQTTFEVGASGRKSLREIMDAVQKHFQPSPGFLRSWSRRVYEDAPLVWELAMEARDMRGVGNKAGWANRAYMKEKKLGRYAKRIGK